MSSYQGVCLFSYFNASYSVSCLGCTLRYREALDPKIQCSHQHLGSMYVDAFRNEPAAMDPKARAKSEMIMVREFMSFVVTRLQVLLRVAVPIEC